MRFLLVFVMAAASAFAADLVLRNGKIVTLDPKRGTVEALAATGGRVVAIGTNAEIAKHVSAGTEVIDLQGRLAIPGFIEGHGHFSGVGQMKLQLNLRGAKNWDQIVGMVGAAAKEAKPGQWIVGRGWYQPEWDRPPEPNVHGFPVHDSLSKVTPNNPVLLTHTSGHASFANAEAMRRAGVTKETKDPPGGELGRDKDGNPTGFFSERAQGLIRSAMSRDGGDRADQQRILKLAADECLRYGITTFQDAGSEPETIALIKKLADAGQMPVRLWVMVRASLREMEQGLKSWRTSGDFLTVRAIKRSIDGALGSRGAWLLEPYSDLPSTRGLNTDDPKEIEKIAELAIQNGYQLCVHAIGDRANREVLDIYERAFQKHPDKKDLRWRIEHSQHLHPADIPRFGKLGVIASMQGVHCTTDAPMVTPRLGPKRAEEGAYVWQSLMKSGARVINGTDAPVDDLNPFASFYASVTRHPKGMGPFYPKQAMSRMEALRSYTTETAWAGFEEKNKGTLEIGKFADIAVLSKDILTVVPEEILKAEADYTIVGGKVAYKRGSR